MQRRIFLGAGALALTGATATFALWPAPAVAQTLTAPELRARLQAGEITLIDIRTPEEWAATGIAEGALPLDMRAEGFVAGLQAALNAHPDRPIALICATGGRSRFLAGQLEKAGLTGVIDVPEGMMGSRAGPGWIKRGLPVMQVPPAS